MLDTQACSVNTAVRISAEANVATHCNGDLQGCQLRCDCGKQGPRIAVGLTQAGRLCHNSTCSDFFFVATDSLNSSTDTVNDELRLW